MFTIESIERIKFNYDDERPIEWKESFPDSERTKSENYFSAAIHNAIRDFTAHGYENIGVSLIESDTCKTVTMSNDHKIIQIQWNWS